jgi:hypothetical protein
LAVVGLVKNDKCQDESKKWKHKGGQHLAEDGGTAVASDVPINVFAAISLAAFAADARFSHFSFHKGKSGFIIKRGLFFK